MTRYIAAYDTEHPKCPAACEKIVRVHREFEMPATFYLVGQHLRDHADHYRGLLDNPLFEIASHTWSHKMLKPHPICGSPVAGDDLADEVIKGKQMVEEVFDRECLGLRPGCSFDDGLCNAPQVLKLVEQAGYKYVSSLAWGPGFTLPAPLNQPRTYQADGYPDLWELPCHGWHDNVLTTDIATAGNHHFSIAWPITQPEIVPPGPVETPEQEAAIFNRMIDLAVEQQLPFVSLIWHPWSLDRFDPQMRMVRAVFEHVRELGLPSGTYADLYHACVAGSAEAGASKG